MAQLHLALHEGFASDFVLIRLDDEIFFEATDVTTRTQIGFATSFEQEVESGEHRLLVLLPDKYLRKETSISVATHAYVGVSRRGDDLDIKVSEEPFRYM